MEIIEILKNPVISAIVAGTTGIVFTLLTQRILKKSGLFTYFVNHQRVGISTNDSIFGTVSVLWNQTPIPNLYLSVVEMKNESMNDYDDIVVRAFTNDCQMLSEQTQVLGSPNTLRWTDSYRDQVIVPEGGSPTDAQKNLYFRQREYLIPVLNRGEAVRLAFLTSSNSEKQPNIWLSVTKVGVRLKFRGPQKFVLGVEQRLAGFCGVLIGLVLLSIVFVTTSSALLIGSLAFIYGLFAQIPGAYFIRVLRWVRDVIGK